MTASNTWEIEIENIAGIHAGRTTLKPGVNTIEASNWQGKSSLIEALKAVMGVATPLRSGAEEGFVRLTTPEDTYEVRLVRSGEAVIRTDDSDPYLADEAQQEIARLFAVLDESNPVRHAVSQAENLEDLLLQPLDLENLQDQISELQHERDQIQAEIDRAEAAKRELTTKEQELAQKRRELSELKEQRDTLDIEASAQEVEQKRDTLSDKRSKRDRVERNLDHAKKTVAKLENKIDETKDKIDDLSVPDQAPEPTQEISNLEAKKSELDREVDLLRDIKRVNERILEENQLDLVTTVNRELTETEIECWICGADATEEAIESRLSNLDSRIKERQNEINRIESEINDKQREQREYQEKKQKKQRLKQELSDYRERLESKQTTIQNNRDQLKTLTEEIDTLAADIDDEQQELIELESKIKTITNDIEDLQNQIDDLEQEIAGQDIRSDQLEEIKKELTRLRSREERKKQEIQDRFETALDDMIDLFEPGFGGGHLANFEIRLAREGRNATIDNLSEGERELLGIITALAGFETFDVDQITPIFLLDSVGMLSPQNLEILIEYLEDRTDVLLTTAYPEQVKFRSHKIDPQEWDVVADEASA